jgi:glycoside/pentoside/hexuronide:cation symporter, GPH family
MRPNMSDQNQKLSFLEKLGYSGGDAAANFVFMTMILFQANFYTDVFGLSAGLAGTIILVSRMWDAFFDPIMGMLADRTKTRWGRFRPWVLWTSIPWAVAMVAAYTTPSFGGPLKIAYAFATNILLMTLYSANNMPYSALGGVMTGDVLERTKLNSFRFVLANVAQFIVGGFTLTLVAKFAGPSLNRQHGWTMTMALWASICLVLFLVTFFSTKERIQPPPKQKTSPKQDFADLVHNRPWAFMFFMTLVHFAFLAMRGGAWYNYFHNYADKTAMYNWLHNIGLTTASGATSSGILETLGYIVHGDPSNLTNSNVADVFNSIYNMLGTATTILVIILFSTPLTKRFGKKAVATVGFTATMFASLAFYLLKPTSTNGMMLMTVITSICYAPTIPLIWAMFADAADYSEWKTGRRATGIIFATIGFALKAGLSLGSAFFLWLMASWYGYDTHVTPEGSVLQGFRMFSSVYLAILLGLCVMMLIAYPLTKNMTIQIADELAERRRKFASESPAA